MNKDTQTLLALIQRAEVAKNREQEAKRVADIKERNRVAMQEVADIRLAECKESARKAMETISSIGVSA